MPDVDRDRLRAIKTFPSLVKYLRDELDWPIEVDYFDDLTFEYEAEELGIDPRTAAKIQEIKQLRPLTTRQPWGIFFIKFEPKRLPVVALRRILSQLVVKKRASARKADQPSWHLDDLLFISNYGEGEERQITFAHFSQEEGKQDLPTLKVLGWDDADTALHLDHIHFELKEKLRWPRDENDFASWREQWSSAFILRHRQVITTSRELAVSLADLARRIRRRAQQVLAIETENGPLRKLHKAFQSALIHDLNEDDFADMYAQTIAYGLLAARVSRPLAITADTMREMAPITNPFLREMLGAFLKAGGRKGKLDFDELGVQDVVELLNSPDTHLEAVLRDFGNRTRQEDPVIHFYELFLQEYDRQKKVERGIFYTPQPVVSYIVRSVHELLQTEFGLEDGLADTTTWREMARRNVDIKIPDGLSADEPFVNILDIATGTATFLVEVIDVIYETMTAKWKRQGMSEKERDVEWNTYVPKHLLPRLYGFELMMAPYAIAHMKIGLKLLETGYKFGSDERVRIYLTNSLEPPQDFADQFEFMAPALANEAKAVNEVKRHKHFTVLIGNPPYARHSSNPNRDSKGQLTFIGCLVEEYKEGCPELRKPAQAKYLQDDYLKFFRLSEYLITKTGVGAIGLITSHGYLDNPTLRGVRNHLLGRFTSIDVLDLHGNTNRKERSPDGSEDKNVFDIKQGVAISISCRLWSSSHQTVQHGDLWGTREGKYQMLANNTRNQLVPTKLKPKAPLYLLCPQDEANESEYTNFPSVREAFSPYGDPAPGIVTTQDEFAVAFSKEEIISKVETLLRTKTEEEARDHFRLCTQSQWDYARAKRELADGKWRTKVIPLYYRPFDVRFTVYDQNVAVHRRERVTRHLLGGRNIALLTSRMTKGETFKHVQVTRLVPEVICMSPMTSNNGFVFPLWLQDDARAGATRDMYGIRTNLAREFVDKVRATLRAQSGDAFGAVKDLSPENIFHYIYAILHSLGYRNRYMEFLKRDFPRIPLTGNQELYCLLASLGAELVPLHLLESPKLNHFITTYTGPKNFEDERVGWSEDTVWIDAAATKKGQPATPGIIGFRGVPEEVWNFQIGGYQVCEKWLKDRKGRKLSAEDIAHYQKIIVALSETIRLMREIDEVIEAHGGWPDAFVTDTKASSKELSGVEPEKEITSYSNGEPAQLPWSEKVAEPSVDAEGSESSTEEDGREEIPANINDTNREDRIAVIREIFSATENAAGLDRKSAIREVAKAMGFDRLGPRTRECIEGDLIAATRRGVVVTEQGFLHLDCRSIDNYPRELLKQYLQSVMGTTWWDQDDAIRAAARYLGFRRTGSAIQEAFKSAISGAIRQGLIERDGSRIRRIS